MRFRVAVAGGMALLLFALSSCSSAPLANRDLHAGSFGGVPGFQHVRADQRYGIAFPLIKNETDRPVVVQRVGLAHLPAGLRLIGMRALASPRSNIIVLSVEGTGERDDYLTYPNLFQPGTTTIPPHSTGGMYFALDLRATRPDPGIATGCVITYRTQHGATKQQTFKCGYDFGSIAHPYHG